MFLSRFFCDRILTLLFLSLKGCQVLGYKFNRRTLLEPLQNTSIYLHLRTS